MKNFWRNLNSILFDETPNLDIKTNPFISQRFGLPIYAGARTSPELLKLVLRAKEDNDLLARRFLANLIIDAITLIKEREILVIPIPSRAQANWQRGINHLNLLVKEVSLKHKIEARNLLQHTKQVLDQTKLSARERLENMTGAFEVRNHIFTSSAFLIDDLVTSGATVRAANEALKVRNIQVLGVITACASAQISE